VTAGSNDFRLQNYQLPPVRKVLAAQKESATVMHNTRRLIGRDRSQPTPIQLVLPSTTTRLRNERRESDRFLASAVQPNFVAEATRNVALQTTPLQLRQLKLPRAHSSETVQSTQGRS